MSRDFRVKVFVVLELCTVFMASCGCGELRQRRSTDKDPVQISIRDNINGMHREKRSMPMLIAKLIRSANPLFKDKDSRIYEKPGGFTQALDDFDRLHATNVKRTGTSRSGDVGDTKVTLQESFGRFTMSFWKPVQHRDGTKDFLVNKIHYQDKF